jgi:hypothetical protein
LTFFSCVSVSSRYRSQQQVQELALDLQDLDHLQHAAARGIDGAGPRPGARIAFVAVLRDLRQVH